ncbi:uncharacterized protein B0I36DRAFT_327115 [Microdochium trichocladiopsis]|uniref:Uncharacterized protein n=1 Tax=Microdochium trichocladiopsis TaxID=1682393 RepID=A0A9P8Y4K7_9PEZI|nr:uncharacterized protein B0I36DRAFT_327115 [Microdochium trichocladiopsis]KAH7027456.1 hypothetical protein B0I36DRAFT_327115 [Microdochium trichocladiopsis]
MTSGNVDQQYDRSWIGNQNLELGDDRNGSPFSGRRALFSPIGNQEISYKSRARRECWFYTMVVLSIFPFFSLLVLMGVFDEALSWITKGEAHSLTKRQKRIIQTMFIAECIVYTGCMASLIVYFVIKSQGL